MNKNTNIRALISSDLPAIKKIIDENQMFPSEFLDEMTEGYLTQQASEFWFVSENQLGNINAVAYCAPERMTEGTWNLLLIAVSKSEQGSGVGTRLMSHVEQSLIEINTRVLLVETSGLPEYQLTREFYPKVGYKQVAIIPEYYDKGDDKVVFWKSLSE